MQLWSLWCAAVVGDERPICFHHASETTLEKLQGIIKIRK